MKKVFFILTAVLVSALAMAQEQEQPEVAAQGTQLVCDGNTYYYGANEVMNQKQMLDWYARHNCQAAYDQFAKGQKLAKAGWVCLGIGAALDLGSLVSGIVYLADRYDGTAFTPSSGSSGRYQWPDDPAFTACVALGLCALPFEIACIPTLVVGYHKMHSSVDIYNVECKTASVRPYWTLQASSNGIGLAMKF